MSYEIVFNTPCDRSLKKDDGLLRKDNRLLEKYNRLLEKRAVFLEQLTAFYYKDGRLFFIPDERTEKITRLNSD